MGNDKVATIPTEIPFHFLNLTTFPSSNFWFARSIFYQQIHHHDCFGIDSNDNRVVVLVEEYVQRKIFVFVI